MDTLRLNIRTVARQSLLGDEEALGTELVQLVREALSRGVRSAAVVRVRQTAVDIIELAPAVRAGVNLRAFLASLTRVEGDEIEALGLIGRLTFTPRRGEQGIPVAVVFLEWEDNRWWHYRAFLDGDGGFVEDSETVQSAIEGDAMPSKLGRWWALGRRRNVTARLAREASPAQQARPGLVH